ncbi:hypothetical protein BDB00DRAFT_820745 [Zychaea mexicana]|uniref:uncharacterized protein n=1 Tax=Zychaea mexicana TaxID=64656 RepID=UPI0022FDF07B|nr:uncharacterized protein BDB00DRAFT_820745 [Zychaea mexicana]KAI9494072.1 hypothetical protein BDB00DRAFT_820745 [Zychaea mexicana]
MDHTFSSSLPSGSSLVPELMYMQKPDEQPLQSVCTTNTTTPHLYSASCGYCHYAYPFDDDLIRPTIANDNDDTPFQYNYLLSLFTAPDMAKHLAQTNVSEDVYALPIHLQRLISEAKEEVVLERIKATQNEKQNDNPQQPLALTRLERVRNYVWMQSGGDVANLMMTLTELMSDEDELENVLGI